MPPLAEPGPFRRGDLLTTHRLAAAKHHAQALAVAAGPGRRGEEPGVVFVEGPAGVARFGRDTYRSEWRTLAPNVLPVVTEGGAQDGPGRVAEGLHGRQFDDQLGRQRG